jgi:hypothetical protein
MSVTWDQWIDREGEPEAMTCCDGTSDAGDWDQVAVDLRQFWLKVWDRFSQPSVAQEKWSVILCMFSPDGGSIHAQPANLPFERKIGMENVMLCSRFIEELWHGLPDPDAAAFDAAHEKLEQLFFTALQSALDSPEVARRIPRSFQDQSVRIVRVTFDDMETAVEMKFPR